MNRKYFPELIWPRFHLAAHRQTSFMRLIDSSCSKSKQRAMQTYSDSSM